MEKQISVAQLKWPEPVQTTAITSREIVFPDKHGQRVLATGSNGQVPLVTSVVTDGEPILSQERTIQIPFG
jgi:hypothetical protein